MHCGWGCKMGRLLWKTMEVPQKLKNRITARSSSSTCGSIPPKNQKQRPTEGFVHSCLSSITLSGQIAEAAQLSADGLRVKQNVTCAHNRILLSLRKEGSSDTCYNTDES